VTAHFTAHHHQHVIAFYETLCIIQCRWLGAAVGRSVQTPHTSAVVAVNQSSRWETTDSCPCHVGQVWTLLSTHHTTWQLALQTTHHAPSPLLTTQPIYCHTHFIVSVVYWFCLCSTTQQLIAYAVGPQYSFSRFHYTICPMMQWM